VAVHVTSGRCVDDLVVGLAELLATPQPDALSPDVVVVPGQGMVDWLQESLSVLMGADGVVANVHFWHPSEFVLKSAGMTRSSVQSWEPPALQWTVLEYLSTMESAGERPPPGYVEATRKVSYARRVAELFDRYATHRPEMVLEWLEGRDTDGAHPLPRDMSWQPALWRSIRAILGESGPECTSGRQREPVELHPMLAGGRLSFFGLESLSRTAVDILRVLGTRRDVRMFHLSPSAAVAGTMAVARSSARAPRRDLDPGRIVRNPLLVSWVRPALESAALLSTLSASTSQVDHGAPDSVLGRMQRRLFEDEPGRVVDDERELLGRSDGSVQIHRCHGATRQVEVLRDALLHILKSDPSLSPRDVLVMCPDLERFGPIIEPIMTIPMGAEENRLRIALVDRSNATASPVAVTLDAVLGLIAGRCGALEVLEVVSLEPVRRTLGLDDDGVAAISGWIADLGVRWGLDDRHRGEWGYPGGFEDGTWRWTVDRLISGILVQSAEPVETAPGIAAFDDVGGGDIDVIGRLHGFLSELGDLRDAARGDKTLHEWVGIVRRVCGAFLPAEGDDDLVSDIGQMLGELEERARDSRTATFGIAELREIVSSSLPAIRGRAAKWSDVVRVGSPSRFRGIPARVVAILGLDQDAFRGARAGGDDILARDPWVGERDPRADERLALLTTIHAARSHLVVTCDGYDVNDNSEVPMPVVLEELKDEVVRCIATMPESARQMKPLVINHSRQAVDPANLEAGGPEDDDHERSRNAGAFVGGAWTFDPAVASILAARSSGAAGGNGSDDGFGTPLLPDGGDESMAPELDLGQLVNAVKRPTDVFVSQRLGVLMPKDELAHDPEVPLWPGSLEYAVLGRELLDAQMAGERTEEWWPRRRLRGGLPPGRLGDEVVERLNSDVAGIVEAARAFVGDGASEVDVALLVPNGSGPGGSTTVRGRVVVHGDVLLSLGFSKWHPRLRLQPWIELAALTLHDRTKTWKAVVVTRGDATAAASDDVGPPPVKVVEFCMRGGSGDERWQSAVEVLRCALLIRRTALRVPVPLFERTSWVREKSKSALETDFGYDLDHPAHQLVYGNIRLADLRSERPIRDVDPSSDGRSRFDVYADLLTSTWEATTVAMGVGDTEPEEDPR